MLIRRLKPKELLIALQLIKVNANDSKGVPTADIPAGCGKFFDLSAATWLHDNGLTIDPINPTSGLRIPNRLVITDETIEKVRREADEIMAELKASQDRHVDAEVKRHRAELYADLEARLSEWRATKSKGKGEAMKN